MERTGPIAPGRKGWCEGHSGSIKRADDQLNPQIDEAFSGKKLNDSKRKV